MSGNGQVSRAGNVLGRVSAEPRQPQRIGWTNQLFFRNLRTEGLCSPLREEVFTLRHMRKG